MRRPAWPLALFSRDDAIENFVLLWRPPRGLGVWAFVCKFFATVCGGIESFADKENVFWPFSRYFLAVESNEEGFFLTASSGTLFKTRSTLSGTRFDKLPTDSNSHG